MTENKSDGIVLGDIVRLDDKTKGIVVSIFTAENKSDGIVLGDIVRLDDKTKGIVVSIFTGYKQREMVDIMTYKDYPKIITAYLDDVKKTGEHLKIFTEGGVSMSKLKETESIIEYIAKLKDTVDIDSIKTSHKIMKKRNLALLAAHKELDSAYSNYRKKIADKLHKDESEDKND